jgi:hypothetical protein
VKNELTIHEASVGLLNRVQTGLRLNRAQTKMLLREIVKMLPPLVKRAVMESQLRAILARRDWLLISVSAENTIGLQIGIVQAKELKIKQSKLSPMQKYQQRHGLGRRS